MDDDFAVSAHGSELDAHRAGHGAHSYDALVVEVEPPPPDEAGGAVTTRLMTVTPPPDDEPGTFTVL